MQLKDMEEKVEHQTRETARFTKKSEELAQEIEDGKQDIAFAKVEKDRALKAAKEAEEKLNYDSDDEDQASPAQMAKRARF